MIKDEFIGFDNFLAVACIDLVPSTAPSDTPSSSPTLTPTREPPRPRPVVPCFSGNNVVHVKNEGDISIQDLKLNDWILGADDKYERVISWGHKSTTQKAKFIQLHPSMLELTETHMVYVSSRAHPIPASMVKVGDTLAKNGDVVTRIATVRRRGVYNPYTLSGEIVVNGELCSVHCSHQENADVIMIGSMRTILSWHTFVQFILAPLRISCGYMGPCVSEEYTEDGIVVWAQRILDLRH
jgi:hypothetical protein